MSGETELIGKLTTLNHIAETLNRAVDVSGVLGDALADLVGLMGLETGWIFVRDQENESDPAAGSYRLAAHHNLPPALAASDVKAWAPGCACQRRCDEGCTAQAYNATECSRLASAQGDRRGLLVHASAPLRSGDRTLGLLNVAGPNYSAFSPEALALLTNVGSQIGVALERARLFDLLREQRIQEQAVLLSFSGQLLSRLDLEDVTHYLVEQVRQILQVDASALLLPGEDPSVFEFCAASGWLSDPVAAHRQIQADAERGPALAMQTQLLHSVPDLEQSDLAALLPDWVRAEGFRGYAVVPLLAEGCSIGLLTVQVRQPRTLDESSLRLLRLMANQAALAIEKARLHQEEVKGQALEKEIELGQKIQLSLLPATTPVVPGWEFAVFYQAARLVGGDFYDFLELPGDPDRLGLVVADVMGKGVPAAMFMAVCRTVIRTAAMSNSSPAVVLTQANPIIWDDAHLELFLSALYATLDTASGRLIYSNAGHPPPLWLSVANGQFRELADHGLVLGAVPEIELRQSEVELAPGDLLVLYTDGITEATDSKHRLFGSERLKAAVATRTGDGAQQVLDSVVAAIRAFHGDLSQSDDITIVVVRRCP